MLTEALRTLLAVSALAIGLGAKTTGAQGVDIERRPLNGGLIGGVVLDPSGKPIANATVRLWRVSADVSECVLRIYGPHKGMNKSVTTNKNGVFLIAFEWEPEQIGCVLGGPQPKAQVNVLVFDARNNYKTTYKDVPLLLAPNLPVLLKGITPQAGGPLGDELNKRIKEAAKDNPALQSYLRSLSDALSVELYGLLGDAGAISAARPRPR